MRFIYTIYVAFLALLTIGCEHDTLVHEVTYSDDVILNLGITTKATTDNNSIFDSEDEIKTLRVYAFNGGGQFDRMEYFDAPQDVYEMEVERSDDKDLYFIVNEPAGIRNELNDIKTVASLKASSCTIANFLTKNGFNGSETDPSFSMPMSATLTGIDASQNRTLSVSVDRCVARVDLYMKMGDLYSGVTLNESTTFEIHGVHDDVIIISGTIPTVENSDENIFTTAAASTDISKTSSTRILSFYAAERKYDHETTPIIIKGSKLLADSAEKEFSVTLGDTDDAITSPLSQITRNTIYQINVTYGVEVAVDKSVNYKIIDWNTVDVDGDLSGVILAIDGVVAMDWFRNGYSYTAPVAAFGGDREIEVYIPQSRNDNGTYNYNETPLVTLKSDSSTDVTNYNILGLTDYDNITNWIAGANLTTSALSGQIIFTYTPQDIPYEYETFPIKIKSQNIIKTMNVIYDNGYIPQANIPTATEIEYLEDLGIGTDWIYEITNGMVVAKRGEAKHPATTEDVFYANEYIYNNGSWQIVTDPTTLSTTAVVDFLYDGEYAMTGGEDAIDYCTKRLGENWYLPSKDMLRVVQLKGKELGTSYRFQNTSGTYYWSSTPDPDGSGKYYAVPMENGSTSKEELREISEKHYVRCFLNM